MQRGVESGLRKLTNAGKEDSKLDVNVKGVYLTKEKPRALH